MFLHPLGLLALLGVPLVVGLHLFRRRFRPREVSALFLWDERSLAPSAGRRRERLLRSPSFWSEVGAALLLGLAFAGPKACGTLRARHLVAVLDGSASMSAVAEGASFRERAVAALRERIAELPSGSRVTLIVSGARPEVLAGPAAFPEEATALLDEYEPRAGVHDTAPATALALQLAGEGVVWLFTDRYEPEAHPAEIGVHAVGRPLDNVSIARASRLRVDHPGSRAGERVLLTVASHADAPRAVTLSISAAGTELESRALELQPGARRHLQFDLPAGAPPVEVRLTPDALAIDDALTLLSPPRRVLGLASALEPGLARRMGFEEPRAGGSPISRWLELAAPSADVGDPALAHLCLAEEPAGSPSTWCLSLESAPGERLDLVGPFLIERRHPLLEGLTLEGVVWSASADLRLPGTPLVSAGNLPLLTEERRGERLVVHANLDPYRSSLGRSPDWPILLTNLATLRRAELPGPRSTNLVAGEPFVFRAPGAASYVLRGPDGERQLRARDTLVVEGLGAVGRYTLERDGRDACEFTLRFADAAESDLRGLSNGKRAPAGELAEVEAASSWLVQVLTALAVAALVLDWLFLSRGDRLAVRS